MNATLANFLVQPGGSSSWNSSSVRPPITPATWEEYSKALLGLNSEGDECEGDECEEVLIGGGLRKFPVSESSSAGMSRDAV